MISYSDLYETEMDYTTYQTNTTGFDGEGQIDSAISYVTSENLPVIYTLEGHEELELNSSLTDSLQKANYDVQSLNLLTQDAVPEDTSEWKPETAPQAMVTNRIGNIYCPSTLKLVNAFRLQEGLATNTPITAPTIMKISR